jgi:hypothetical protein
MSGASLFRLKKDMAMVLPVKQRAGLIKRIKRIGGGGAGD